MQVVIIVTRLSIGMMLPVTLLMAWNPVTPLRAHGFDQIEEKGSSIQRHHTLMLNRAHNRLYGIKLV